MDSPTYSGALGRGRLTTRAYARVGLFGNPSDGYGGKTIALTIANFWAEATIALRKDYVWCRIRCSIRALAVSFFTVEAARPRRWRGGGAFLEPRDTLRGSSTRLTSRRRRDRVDATHTSTRRSHDATHVTPSTRLQRRCDFGGLRDLHFISRREGYQGGMRLLQAACKRFLWSIVWSEVSHYLKETSRYRTRRTSRGKWAWLVRLRS